MYQAMPALGLLSLLRDYLVPFSWASLAWQSYALATWWMELATGVPLDFNCYRVLTAQPSTATFPPPHPREEVTKGTFWPGSHKTLSQGELSFLLTCMTQHFDYIYTNQGKLSQCCRKRYPPTPTILAGFMSYALSNWPMRSKAQVSPLWLSAV